MVASPRSFRVCCERFEALSASDAILETNTGQPGGVSFSDGLIRMLGLLDGLGCRLLALDCGVDMLRRRLPRCLQCNARNKCDEIRMAQLLAGAYVPVDVPVSCRTWLLLAAAACGLSGARASSVRATRGRQRPIRPVCPPSLPPVCQRGVEVLTPSPSVACV